MKYLYNVIFSTALLTLLVAGTPADDLQSIISRLEDYYKAYPQTRVHLVLNQPKYSPGDTAYFKAFFLTEDFRPIPDKQIITLELRDQLGNVLQAQNIRVIDGEGHNQMVFATDLAVGVYNLVAYSEVMKNLDASLYFSKRIIVTGRKGVSDAVAKNSSLMLYPEGGSFVEETENHIIAQSLKSGTGKILDQTGMLVSEFQIGKEGVASFSFVPKKGNSYYSLWNGEQSPIEIRDDACAIKVTALGSGGAEINVSVSPSTNLARQELFFLALSKGRVVYSTPLRLESGTDNFAISVLHPGLNQFFIFDKKDNLLAERVYYVAPSTAAAEISMDPPTVNPRGLVSASIAITNESGRPVGGSFITRAWNAQLFKGTMQASFDTELNLFNDLPALRYDFEQSGLTEEEWMKELDARLITQRWARINWKDVLTPQKDRVKHSFKYSLDLKGKAIFKSTGEPVPDSTLILIYQQKSMVGYETYTSKKGEFVFPFLYDFTGTDQIFYMMEFKRKEKQQDFVIIPEIEISNVATMQASEGEGMDAYGEYKFRKQLIDRSFAFFADPNKSINAKEVNPNAEYEDELGGVDVSMKVDDYLVFPTMADLIHEVISGLQHRVVGGTSIVRVVFIRNTYTVIPKGDPLYIIDGVFTKNTEFFLGLNPEDILSVKIVNNEKKLQRFGGMGKFGVVFIQTKKSIAKKVIENSTVFTVSGLSPELEFKIPSYSSDGLSRKPDLRSTIYWNPGYTTNSSGMADIKFNVSDDASPVAVEVMGLTSDGRPFSTRQTIDVQAPVIRP